jgi:hypothetical protein
MVIHERKEVIVLEDRRRCWGGSERSSSQASQQRGEITLPEFHHQSGDKPPFFFLSFVAICAMGIIMEDKWAVPEGVDLFIGRLFDEIYS